MTIKKKSRQKITARRGRGRPYLGRRIGVLVRLAPDLRRELGDICRQRRMSLQAALEEALRAWLAAGPERGAD